MTQSSFEKYASKGAYHWNTYYQPLMRSNPYFKARYDLVSQIVTTYLKQRSEITGLDIGCGDGLLVHLLAAHSQFIYGLDLETEGLKLAVQQLRKHHSNDWAVLQANCYQIPLPDDSLDYVTSIEIIEHLEQPEQMLAEGARLLKSNGVFVCTTPRRFAENDPVQDPYHVQEFMPHQLRELMLAHFDRVEVKGYRPAWLERFYTGLTQIAVLDKSVRLALRLIAGSYNPYTRAVYDEVDIKSCTQLVGIGHN